MYDFGEYILMVGLGAVLVSILNRFLDNKSSTGNLCRMICGLFLAFTVLKPFVQLDLGRLETIAQAYSVTADAAAAQGEVLANEAAREIIKQKTEAYILDKAGLYDCHLHVEIAIGEGNPPVPESVVIHGDASPYARMSLQRLIAEDLNIPKEHQKWIG